MKKTTLLLGVLVLAFASMGFECSVTTANLSDIKIASDKEGKSVVSSADVGKPVFCIVEATGIPSGKHKVAWKVTFDNVAGKNKGDKVGEQSMDITQSSQLWTEFTAALPGDYKVEATLTDEGGKTIATKSSTIKVTGSAPAAPAAKNDDKDGDEDK